MNQPFTHTPEAQTTAYTLELKLYPSGAVQVQRQLNAESPVDHGRVFRNLGEAEVTFEQLGLSAVAAFLRTRRTIINRNAVCLIETFQVSMENQSESVMGFKERGRRL